MKGVLVRWIVAFCVISSLIHGCLISSLMRSVSGLHAILQSKEVNCVLINSYIMDKLALQTEHPVAKHTSPIVCTCRRLSQAPLCTIRSLPLAIKKHLKWAILTNDCTVPVMHSPLCQGFKLFTRFS